MSASFGNSRKASVAGEEGAKGRVVVQGLVSDCKDFGLYLE